MEITDQDLMLITGATGLVGSHVAERASKQGIRTRALVRSAADTSLLADVVRHLVEEPGMDTGTLIGCFVGREGYDELAALAGEEALLPKEAVVLDLDARARRYIVKRRGSALLRKALESGSMEDAQRRWSDAKAQQAL